MMAAAIRPARALAGRAVRSARRTPSATPTPPEWGAARRWLAAEPVGNGDVTVGSAGWPPGLFLFDAFGSPTPAEGRKIVRGARALIAAVGVEASKAGVQPRSAAIPQPIRSMEHNLAEERHYLPLRVHDPVTPPARQLRCEHFDGYGSGGHALTYFRDEANIPGFVDPIRAALRATEVVRALAEAAGAVGTAGGGGNPGVHDEHGLQWKLTLNHYKAGGDDAGARTKGLFPWHTDLAANGEFTSISTLLGGPVFIEFASHADLDNAETPTRIVARPGSMVLLSGAARWDWVHRVVPHPDGVGKERISAVLGCQPLGWRPPT